jgi:hypothetical protein
MDAAGLHTLDRALPRGEQNATSIPALCRALGWTDRQTREGIEQLITEGLEPQARDPQRVPVVTLPKRDGVFVATSPEELELAIKGIRGRAMALLRRQRGLRLCREPLTHPQTLF